MKLHDPVAVIEAAYDLTTDTPAWLESVAAASAFALGSKQGAIAFQYDASSGTWINVLSAASHQLGAQFIAQFLDHPNVTPENARDAAHMFLSNDVGSVRLAGERVGMSFDGLLRNFGVEEMVGINARDPSGRGCLICVADRARKLPARSVAVFRRLGRHIAAAARLRTTLSSGNSELANLVERAEAVLTPKGRIEHAIGKAQRAAAREALREALVRIEAARGCRNSTPERAVDIWRGLVEGRWSILEHFDRDGKRYFLAHKNEADLARDFALTPREQQVLAYANMGYSNKLIGYSLGLSRSTVSTLLTRARRKLGPGASLGMRQIPSE
ncbi:MAG TPA: LuxR C-terminal-related transcriptional regulator [Polyangiaceae bacterium]|nr:LuxR C-terminal-related transcriptional regulator [Polyangiaceae bacterium]